MNFQIPEQLKRPWAWAAIIIVILAFVCMGRFHDRYDYNGQAPATITVSGKGEIKATPDVSKFMVTVEETAKDQKTALANASTKINAVIDALKKAGIDEKDIKTEYTSVNPHYEFQKGDVQTMMYPQPGNQVITGYTASHTLSVKVRNLDSVSTVQKIFADNKVQNVSGPDLSIDNPDQLQIDARGKAIADAQSQAEILAKQLGVHLGKVMSFSESSGDGYPVPMYARADAAVASEKANPEPTIATGEQTITSNVSITYRIR